MSIFEMKHFDKSGQSITLMEWAELREDWSYRVIGEDRSDLLERDVSTVWIGQEHNRFETMVFDDATGYKDVYVDHAFYEEDAKVMHARVVEEYITNAEMLKGDVL